MPRILVRVRNVLEAVQGVGLVAIVVLILASIFLRNFLNHGLVWIFEVTGLLMVWIVFLGAPRNLIDHGEIRVDSFAQIFGLGVRKLLWLFQKTVVLLTLCALVYYFVGHAGRFGGLSTPTLGIPQIIFYGAVFVGPVIGIAVTIWHFIEFFRGKVSDDRL